MPTSLMRNLTHDASVIRVNRLSLRQHNLDQVRWVLLSRLDGAPRLLTDYLFLTPLASRTRWGLKTKYRSPRRWVLRFKHYDNISKT